MASAKEIQSRINSIQDTMKITNAMYMISSSKLKRARKVLADTEPYFYALQSAIGRVLRHMPPDTEGNRYFDERSSVPKEERRTGYIVVSADKGLAGAYNHNVFKIAVEKDAHPSSLYWARWEGSISTRKMWMWIPISGSRYRSPQCTGPG